MAYSLIRKQDVKPQRDPPVFELTVTYDGGLYFSESASNFIRERVPRLTLLAWWDEHKRTLGFSLAPEDDPDMIECRPAAGKRLKANSRELAAALQLIDDNPTLVRISPCENANGIFLEGVVR